MKTEKNVKNASRELLKYNDNNFTGHYNSKIETSDFCFFVAEKGTLFSLIVSDELAVKGGVMVKINIKDEKKSSSLTLEGKFKTTSMALTGGIEPSRIYMFIPKSENLPPEEIRNAEFEIVNLTLSDELIYMNNFKLVS